MAAEDAPQGVTIALADPPADVARPWQLSDLLAELLDEAEAQHAAAAAGAPLGPVTGLPRLDRELAGRLVPGYHVLHGNTASGKTTLALQVAATCGCPCVFVSCEMSPVELLRRVIARAAGVYLGRLKSGELTREEFAAYGNAAVRACDGLLLLDATRAWAPPAQVQGLAEDLRERHGAEHVLVVIDSLHAWAAGRPAPEFGAPLSEYEALGAAVIDVQRMAAALNAPVLLVTERNRMSADAGGVNAAAGSRKVEYGAETVLGLYRKSERDAQGRMRPVAFDAAGEAEAHIVIEKNRHGAGESVELRFCGRLQRFREA